VSDFTLPELGENVSAGDVLRVLVKPGDTIAMEQPVLELETDKATIEVPSSVAGTVGEVKVKPGDKVKVGQVILSVTEAGGGPDAGKAGRQEGSKAESQGGKAERQEGKAERQEGSKAESQGGKAERQEGKAERREGKAEGREGKAEGWEGKAEGQEGRRAAAQKPTQKPNADEQDDREEPDGGAVGANTAAKVPDDEPGLEQHVEGERRDAGDKAGTTRGAREAAADAEPAARQKVVDISRGARPAAEAAAPEMPQAPAAPSVRRIARELGVDINQVPGSGPGGRISVDDVKAHAKRLVASAARGAGAAVPLPDFSRWGEVERQPMRAVRRKTAEHLAAAWQTIPHVTQCDLADITSLEELRKKYAKPAEAAGGNLTVTAIAVKVVAAALRVFPQLNSSIDLAADEIILKKYVNIGVAVDTDRGLLVPVIRNADRKNIVQLAAELAQLSEKARTRKISLEEMQGGCFSISNLGGIGGTYFTPIVNAPEVAILGISRARMEPVYQKDTGEFVGRMMLPLSLSYDHRVIDGAAGIRFLRWVAQALEDPFLLSLQG
jgi:pyruvate dehydrogenase E2 component (dihydrolipoamide acetyltransferase)